MPPPAHPTTLPRHLFQNTLLILLSFFFLPITAPVLLLCLTLSRLHRLIFPKGNTRARPPSAPKTILISGLSMTKGLILARTFAAAGYRVIGLDFSTASFAGARVPSAGRFSKALSGYHTLPAPTNDETASSYRDGVLRIIKNHEVDLWIPVSGVMSTIEDAEVAEAVRKEMDGKTEVFCPSPESCRRLHSKYEFVEAAREAGLGVPQTKRVTSRTEVVDFLRKQQMSAAGVDEMKWILKCVATDDVSRADMTTLPRKTVQETEAFLSRFEISVESPWVVQEFVEGAEFCTHAVVVRGEVRAFVACPSNEMLMHYTAVPEDSALSKAMLRFTRKLVRTLDGGLFTGQVSFDFLVPLGQEDIAKAQKGPAELDLKAIESNPRTHTAVVLLAEDSVGLTGAYLSILEQKKADEVKGEEKDVIKNGPKKNGKTKKANGAEKGTGNVDVDGSNSVDMDTSNVVHPPPRPGTRQHWYWMGHDLVAWVVIPLLKLFTAQIGIFDFNTSVLRFCGRMGTGKEAVFDILDPMPWWWLYHVYYPCLFALSLVAGRRWSRVNVSTTRVFESY